MIRLLFFTAFSIFIISCTTSKMNVEQGTFQAIKPPNIYGNNRHLTKDTNYIISYDASIGKNKTIPLPGIMNQSQRVTSEIKLDGTPADINYRLIQKALGFQFSRVTKKEDFFMGFGGGVQNFPYVFFMLGHNGKFIEAGGAAFWGLTIDKASYSGEWGYIDNFTMGITKPIEKYEPHFEQNNVSILHSYGGLTTYASLYWKKVALNYSASITSPWFLISNSLPVSSDYDADISFSFPVLLMQDVGVSFTPYKIKYRLGINQITGVKFPGQHWGLSVQMAYGW
ncbi:MAG: hypothetical protein LBC85_01905 [Fibromonadaceae bacterium]|jgi:hypothetical protein|nr:hypothetical protein [Fibromonadaceae bacterium]